MFRSLISVPWKNGQGRTRQVLSHPEHADLSDFTWRVSMAEINQISSFSNYSNVSRSLTVLSGEGLVLSINGSSHNLSPLNQIIRFDGAVKSEVIHCSEPILDFGVMTQNKAVTHTLDYHSYLSEGYYERVAAVTLICLATAWPVVLTVGTVEVELSQYDCLYLNQNDPSTLKVKVIQTGNNIQLLCAEFFNVVG